MTWKLISYAAAGRRRALALLMIAASMTFAGAQAAARSCERPAQLRFSVIPQGGMQQDIAALQPLLDALEEALKIPVIVVEASSYGAVTEGLLAGAVDLARLGPASYLEAKRADPRVTAFASYARSADIFKQESAFYFSLLIVKAGSPYATLEALRGLKVALVDPDSASGAVIPRHMIRQKTRRELEAFFGKIVYTGTHRNAIHALLRDDIPAAFTSSSHLSDLVAAAQVRLGEVRILWKSGPIPRDPFVYRGQLCEDLRRKIAEVFLRQEGRHFTSLLKGLNATRFFPVGDKDYQGLRDVYQAR